MKSEIINIKIVRKYLLISSTSKLILVKINLFIKTFLGRLNDKIWLREYLKREQILINLKPELVEKKDPPIITKTKNIIIKFGCSVSKEKPIFDILLDMDNKFIEKSQFLWSFEQ